MLSCAIVRALTCGALAALVLVAALRAQERPAPSDNRGDKHRATLDQYCVTCHNDRLKTSNLSLEKLNLADVGDHPEIWERVVRKLRAGVMPPPDIRRPALA